MKTPAILLHFCAVLIFTTAPQRAGGAQSPGQQVRTPALTLRPGDAVRVTVFRNTELSGEIVVAPDGSLRHPLYKATQVSGVPWPSVEAAIRQVISRYVTPDTLFVIEPLLRVTVSGDVGRPNVYNLGPETTVTEAIAIAGGATDRGRRDRATLIRDGRVMVVTLNQPGEGGGRTPIRSGDEITVERDRSAFRDVIAPTVTLLGATAAIINVFLYNRRP